MVARRPIPSRVTTLLLALLTVAAASCSSRVGRIAVSVVRSSDPSEEPLNEFAADVRVTVIDRDGELASRRFPVDAAEGLLPEVPTASAVQILVEGLDPEGRTVSRGRTIPLEIAAGDTEITVYVGRVNAFSLAPAPDGELTARAFHTATPLAPGRVLLCGGSSREAGAPETPWRPEQGGLPVATRTATVIDESSIVRTPLDCAADGCLARGRAGHSATLLRSGNLLIAGGVDGAQPEGKRLVPELELFSAERGAFFTAGGQAMASPRWNHAATLGEQGVVLAGGQGKAATLFSVEAYDKELTQLPQLQAARRGLTLVTLADGAVLAVGGLDARGEPLATTEVLRPGAPAWTPGPALQQARAYHSTVRVAQDTVLIIGGLGPGRTAVPTIERISDLSAPSAELVGELNLGRWAHTATRLADDRILVAGGFAPNLAGAPAASVEEVRISESGVLHVTPGQSLRRPRAGHTATLLRSGMLLVSGGISAEPGKLVVESSAEVFVY